MLTLTRNRDEVVVIRVPNEAPIFIKVMRDSGGHVQLGFDAAAHIEINRLEIDQAIQANGRRPKTPSSDPAHEGRARKARTSEYRIGRRRGTA